VDSSTESLDKGFSSLPCVFHGECNAHATDEGTCV
jgi:hypothetical protein